MKPNCTAVNDDGWVCELPAWHVGHHTADDDIHWHGHNADWARRNRVQSWLMDEAWHVGANVDQIAHAVHRVDISAVFVDCMVLVDAKLVGVEFRGGRHLFWSKY